MAGIPRKRTAVVKTKSGPYKKLTQIKGDSGWIPTALAAVTTSPALASEPKSHRPLRYGKYDRRLHVFRFKITRDDGEIIDHTLMGGISIWQPNINYPDTVRDYVGAAHGYDPEGSPDDIQYWTYDEASGVWSYEKEEWSYVYKFRYNTRTQIWTVPLFKFDERAPSYLKTRKGKIFWARFLVEDSTTAMYKRPLSPDSHPRYTYKTSDWYQEEDKLIPKFYQVRVPYYKLISSVYTGLIDEDVSVTSYGLSGSLTLTVETSVDILIKYQTYTAFGGTQRAAFYGIWCGYDEPCDRTKWDTCAELIEAAAAQGPRLCSEYDGLGFPALAHLITEQGDDVTGTSNLIPYPGVEHSVPALPYIVTERLARISFTYVGPMVYDYIVSCDETTVTFPLTIDRMWIGIAAFVEVDN